MNKVLMSVAILTSLVSCSSVFDVRISGSLEAGVLFSLYEYKKDTPLNNAQVLRVDVYKKIKDENIPVWKLHGSENLTKIEYGTAPDGLIAERDAAPLSIGKIYSVSIQLDGGATYGGGAFCFSDTGEVIQFETYEEMFAKCELSEKSFPE